MSKLQFFRLDLVYFRNSLQDKNIYIQNFISKQITLAAPSLMLDNLNSYKVELVKN